MSDIKRLRVFLSSPGDVLAARAVVREVVEKHLQKERAFANAKLEIVSWDDPLQPLALDAYLTPQQAIDQRLPLPSECDVVVVILWSRMGTPLRHEGRQYLSGTHYEFESAISATERRPRVFVYRWTAPPEQAWNDYSFGETPEQQRAQLATVKKFLSRFRNDDGTVAGSLMSFATIPEFGSMVLRHVGDALQERLEQWRTGQGDLGIALSFRRKLTEFREEYLVSERGRVPFGGRDAELDALDRWLRSEARAPRMLVTAPAGRGKSALIVQWLEHHQSDHAAGRSDWQIAFMPISIRIGTNRPEEFYQGLALRLAEVSNLPLDETKQRDVDYFKASVRKQLENIAERGLRVLVVLDGIDEALEGTFDAGMFPKRMPPTLRLLLSARWQLRDNDSKGWLARLGWDHDTRAETMELDKLNAAQIGNVLVRLAAPLDIVARDSRLVERLALLTEGEPLLVRFYCTDLWDRTQTGARISPADLDTLKPGFDSYFQRWLAHQEQLWKQEGAGVDGDKVNRVLLILAHAQGRLPEEDLLALMHEVHGDAGLAFADGLLRPLRRFVMGDGKPDTGFVLSHPKIGDYLRGGRFRPAEKLIRRAFADWGRKHLAALNAGEIGPEDASLYLLLYLPKHLEAVGAPANDFMAMVENGWRLAWEGFDGGTRGFSEAVKSAWAACRKAGHNAHLGAQLRCALTLSSIKSMGTNIPGPLLVELVIDGTLSPQQARHFCELKGPTAEAVAALARIAIAAADNRRLAVELVTATLDLARSVLDLRSRINCLVVAYDNLDSSNSKRSLFDADQRRSLLDEALEGARSIAFPLDRSQILAAISARIDDPIQRQDLLTEALACARQIEEKRQLARALASVAARLENESQRRAVVVDALEAAKSFGHEWSRSQVLVATTARIGDPKTLTEALAATMKIGDMWARSTVLIAAADSIDDQAQRREVVAAAISAAKAIEGDGPRAHALAEVALRIEDASQRQAMFTEALTTARGIDNQRDRFEVLLAVSAQLDDPQQRLSTVKQLAASNWVRSKWFCSEHLAAALAATGDADFRRGMLAEALTNAKAIGDKSHQTRAQVALAARLGDQDRPITSPVAAIEKKFEASHPAGRETIAEPLADPALLAQELSAAKAIWRERKRSEVLAGLAGRLNNHDQLAEALAAAIAIGHEGFRSEALSAVAVRLKDPQQRSEAIAAACSIKRGRARAQAIAVVAAHVGDASQRRALLAEALALAKAIRSERSRSLALVAVASHLHSSDLLIEALAAAKSIGDTRFRTRAVAGLASLLSEPDQRRAAIQEALSAAEAIADDKLCAETLVELAGYLFDSDLLGRAFAAAEAIGLEQYRTQALVALVIRLRDPGQFAVALVAIKAIGNERFRCEALAALSRYASYHEHVDLMRTIINEVGTSKRPNALLLTTNAVGLIEKTGGPTSLRELHRAIDDVCRWYP